MPQVSYFKDHIFVRDLPTDLEKACSIAIHFREKENFTLKEICSEFDIDKNSLKRGVWSMLNGSPVGKKGESRKLTPEETAELVLLVEEKKRIHDPISVQELGIEVSFMIFKIDV